MVLAACMAGAIAGMSVATRSNSGGSALPAAFASGMTFDEALARGAAEGKPVVAVFSATWCGPCQRYKKAGLADDRVATWLAQHAVTAYVDIDRQPAAAQKVGVPSVPTTVFLRDGAELSRATGAMNPDELLAWLGRFK